MSKNKSATNPRIATLTTMALAFSRLPAAQQGKLSAKTVDKLEKTLAEAAREVEVTIPAGPKAQVAQREAVEILVKTIKNESGGELHVKTPFSTPFLMNCKALPKGARIEYDRKLEVTVFDARYRAEVLDVIRQSFNQCKRPHVLNVDGKRSSITAGTAQ